MPPRGSVANPTAEKADRGRPRSASQYGPHHVRRAPIDAHVRIDRLVADGLARRHPDPDDRRGTRITLTSRGREAFESAAPAHLANEGRLLSALSPDEQRTLASLLRRLLVDLEDVSLPEDAPTRRLGLALAPAHTTVAMRRAVGLPACAGLLVRATDRGGPAAQAGIAPGDVVISVNGREVRAIADLDDPPRRRTVAR